MHRSRLAASRRKDAPRCGSPRSGAATAVGLVFLLAIGTVAATLAVPGAAHAQAAPAPAPPAASTTAASTTPTPTPTGKAVPAPQEPTIDSPPAGSFIGSASTTSSGSRGAGQEIQLLSPTGGDPLCIVAVDGTTSWSCSALALPSGPSVTLRAVVTGEPSLFGDTTLAVLAAPTVTGVAVTDAPG
jgi:hypothetical protein